jgi:hypothetical protein
MLKKIEIWFHLTKNYGIGGRKRKRPPSSLGVPCAIAQEMEVFLYFTPDHQEIHRGLHSILV